MTTYQQIIEEQMGIAMRELRGEVRELLLKADRGHTGLALSLMHDYEKMTGDSCGWDPDGNFDRIESALRHMAELFDLDYEKDITAENRRRDMLNKGSVGCAP